MGRNGPDKHDACPIHEEPYRLCGCPIPGPDVDTFACSFVLYGDDRLDALESRIVAALENEDFDFDSVTVRKGRATTIVSRVGYVHLVHVNGKIADVDDEAIVGPFREGVQLTYDTLRATYEDETIAFLRNGQWFTRDGRGPFSDITFSEDVPASVLPTAERG